MENIIDWIEANIHTQEDWDALPQETRDLYEKAKEAEAAELLAWAAEEERLEEEKRKARLQAIWDAVDNGCSESPNGGW